ncbi:DUF4279 domain-containing protein [Thiosocius teredinicola]|uniref:DUF4279 domain-containing protein n=1 Tax=Thiosocius teredinicola TaxID=1973002 RepID=UPI0013DE6D05
MAPYSYSVSLRIFHPTIDPEEITKALSLAPVRTCKVGMPRETPKGTRLEGEYRESYWYTKLVPEGERYSGDDLLEDFLSETLATIRQYSEFFSKIQRESGYIQLFIGTFGARNYVIELSPKMQAEFGSLGVALCFDVYPGE